MNGQFYIGIGSGIKLLSEDWYIKEFGANITKKAFRAFCRALKVPLIEIGKTTFVEMNSFQLALKAITRVGEPDFFVSGCQSIASGKKKPSKLDSEYVAKNLEPLLCELMACKAISGGKMTYTMKRSAQETAARMARAGINELPLELQNKFTKNAIRVFNSTTQDAKDTLDIYGEENDQ